MTENKEVKKDGLKYKADGSKRKTGFRYAPDTGIFSAEVLCFLDPLQSVNAGKDIYALPPNVTSKKPPKVKKDQVAAFDTEKSIWKVKDYWNNKHFYKKETGDVVSISGFVVEIDDSLTEKRPPSEYHVWNKSMAGWEYWKSGDHRKKIEQEIDRVMSQKSRDDFTWESSGFGKDQWSVHSLESLNYRDVGLYAFLCRADLDYGKNWIPFTLTSVTGIKETFTAEAFIDLILALNRRNMELFNKAQAMKQALYEIQNDSGLIPDEKWAAIKDYEINFDK